MTSAVIETTSNADEVRLGPASALVFVGHRCSAGAGAGVGVGGGLRGWNAYSGRAAADAVSVTLADPVDDETGATRPIGT